MTSSPRKRLGLVIDLNACVGCHACAVACKQENSVGHSGRSSDVEASQASPRGVWPNRVHSYEFGEGAAGRTVYFPKTCLHCEAPACVTVCPTGASYKRADDGIVLIDHDKCIGCKLCAWACPYGAREFDEVEAVMKKCTLCVDRIHDRELPVEDRQPICVTTCPANARHFGDFADPESNVSRLTREFGGFDPLPELKYRPTSKYLPQRSVTADGRKTAARKLERSPRALLDFLDALLTR